MLQPLLLVARWVAALHERIARLREENELLRARLLRLPHRRRPHYRPWERLQILWHATRYGLTVEATARAFVVSFQTLMNWRRDVRTAATSLVRANAPLNRLPDLVADLALRLKREWPRWGTRRVAGILARLGIKASRTSVQRMLRRPPRRPAVTLRMARPARGPLAAKHPGHTYLIDFTRVGGFLRSVFVGAVIDAYSRKVLALRICAHEPSAAFAMRLLREAARDFGAPVWMITDHGRQLTSGAFTRALASRGIRRRFGAIGKSGSLALIERFWRSMKSEFARGLVLYRSLATIERRLRSYAAWFNAVRPHQGLSQRTPDEVHSERTTGAKYVSLRAVLEVEHLDGERHLPVLRLRSAA